MLKIIFCNFKNKKELYLNIINIFVCIFILLITIFLFNYKTYIFNNEILNNLSNRELVVQINNNQNINILTNNKHILDYYPYYETFSYDSYTLKYLSPKELKINLYNNEIAVPKKLELNHEIEINIKNQNIKLQTKDVHYHNNNYIYVSEDIIKNLTSQIDSNKYTAILKSNKDYKFFVEEMKSYNIEVNLRDNSYMSEIKQYENILKFLDIFKWIIYMFIILVIYFNIVKIIKDNTDDLYIMYVLGFKKRFLKQTIFLRYFAINSIAFLVTLFIFNLSIYLPYPLFVYLKNTYFKNIFLIFMNYIIINIIAVLCILKKLKIYKR